MSSAGHVLLATDKFKGSLTAAEATAHLAAGLRRAVPGLGIRTIPVADGGEGTVDAAVEAGFARVLTRATGPTGAPIEAEFAVRGDTAVIEVAEASGLRGLPRGEAAPLSASSYGTGELIRAALDAGCTRIILGLGGSACTDGGAGLVQALGARLLDADGEELPPGGAALARLARVDLTESVRIRELIVACDVDNPLLGPNGAAAVYGPQKGATAEDVALLDAALANWARVVTNSTTYTDFAQTPGAGAAGGIGFAALALLGARLEPGIDIVLDLADFPAKAAGARLIITGEGSLDRQSLRGKAPAGVARAAARSGVPVVAVAGVCTLTPAELEAAGFRAAYALADLEPDLDRCVLDAGPLLERLAAGLPVDTITGAAS
ncbi:glycerate kinase [Catenulispora sp. GP43]|uniref:glycerate kinase n=1 Tax=Catenulispora sp. GP43 TaxID=3156263 RepID=UPI003518E5F3